MLEREMMDECGNGKSWTAVSAGEGNFSQLRGG